ncbi:MAG: SGNH/GDSL hydrolase family protein, partial [Cytophagaceae bacterium]|nr:SGNH/GDSL hydrolase family protein [Gemmatimonadaceae bacterium]
MARAQAASSARDTSALRVLFIGNSYTYFNDLPSVVGDLAAAARERRAFVAEQVTFGGHTIEMHLARPEALAAVRRGRWSLVIVQEQSTRPIEAPQRTIHDVPRIGDEVKKAGAKLLLYLTWAREARPSSQDTLSATYTAAAAAVGASVVPVG